MKKIFITGGAGFIGSHFAEYFVNNNYEVVVLDLLLQGNKIPEEILKKITFVKGDVRDYKLVEELSENADIIIHLAAVLGVDVVADDPILTMETEIEGAENVAKAAVKHNIKKILFSSTSGIYDFNPHKGAMTETIPVDPKSSYAAAKRYVEKYFEAYSKFYGLDTTVVRYFNIYGPRQDDRMVVPRFLKQAINNEPITVYTPGKQTRDFTYIDDTIKSCVLLLEKNKGFNIYNVCNENEITVETVAKTVLDVVKNSKSEITYMESPQKRKDYESPRRLGSAQKLLETTGYKPNTPLKQGIKKFYEYLKQEENVGT